MEKEEPRESFCPICNGIRVVEDGQCKVCGRILDVREAKEARRREAETVYS